MKPLLATLGDLWPGSAGRVISARSPYSPATEVTNGKGFWVVPHARAPRILIPAGNARAACSALHRYSAAISLSETVQRLVLASALGLGAGRALLPDRVQLDSVQLDSVQLDQVPLDSVPLGTLQQGEAGQDSILDYLEGVLGEPLSVSLSIGPARANRKPVLQVFDSKGRSLAFVKVGDTATASGHVSREAKNLALLSTKDFSTLELPTVISFGSWRSMTVLVMSALNTAPAARGLRFARLRERALLELNEAFPYGDSTLGQTPLWVGLRTQYLKLTDDLVRLRFGECLDRLETAFPDAILPVGAWHGDFTPWNMARRRGRLQLWDWERFDEGVPVGLDQLHYPLNLHLRRAGTTLAAILEGLELGAPGFRIPHRQSHRTHAVLGVYLAAISLRYLLGAQGEGGDAISSKSKLMLEALELVTSQGRRLHVSTNTFRDLSHWASGHLPSGVADAARAAAEAAGTVTAGLRMMPSLIIVGTQRSGTTTLYRLLSDHPGVIRPTASKGVGYFDLNYHRGHSWYRGHFPLAALAAGDTHGPKDYL
ncbi:hypothetical protein ACW0JT_22150 [Arthrobacter sp. SA17]